MNQDDWDLYLKSASNSGKKYQSYYQQKKKEEEDKKKNEIAFGGSDPNSKAAKVEQSKGFWGGVGDVVGGVGNFVKDAVISVKDDAVNAVTGIKDTVEGTSATNDQSKLQEGANEIQNKYNKEINNIYGSYIDKGTVAPDGGADESKMSKEDRDKIAAMKAARDKELADYKEKTNYEETSEKNAKEFDEAQAVDAKKTAAAAASTFLNVATLGSGTAVKAGGKQAITQAIKAGGKKAVTKEVAKRAAIAGAEGATFGATGGAASAAANDEDVLEGAARGAVFGGLVGGTVGGATGAGMARSAQKGVNAANKASKEVADELTKLGATPDELDNITNALDAEDAATAATAADEAAYLATRKAEFEEIKANRAEGLNDDGSRIINLDETNKSLQDMQAGNYADDLYDVTTTDGKAADPEFIQAATEKQVATLTAKRDEIAAQVDAIESPAAREMAMANVNKLDDQIAAITSGDTKALMDTGDAGLSRTLNTERVRERFGQLQDDLAEGNFRQRQAQREAEARTQPSRTFDSVSDDIDNLGAGGVAPEAVTPREDFVDIEELPSVEKLPSQLRYRAESLANDRREIEFQRSQLMTDERATQVLDQATDDYNVKLERIDMMPEPRRTAEMDKLQSEFNAKYEEVQTQLANDAQTVAELRRVEEQINANSMELLTDANVTKDTYPQDFGTVDQELNARVSQEIEAETETAIFNRMSNEEGVPDAENISKTWAEAPEDKLEAAATSPQVGELVEESIKDTFTNDGVKMYGDTVRALDSTYVGLAMSSNNVVLEKIFGDVGKKLFNKIIKGYSGKNRADKKVASILTEVKKGLGGDKALYAKAADVLEGKAVDLKDLSPEHVEAIGKLKDLYEYGARIVRKLAYNDVVHAFEKRVADGKIKYTADEIKQFAKRDGTTVKVAGEKYGNVSEFSKTDINFLATNRAENSTLDNYLPHVFDKNGREKEFPDSDYTKSNGTITLGNMLHRLTEGDNYSRDVVDVSARYFSALHKKAHLEPALRELDNAKLAIKAADSDANAAWKWIDKYQAQLKYNKQDAVGKGVNELVDNTNRAINKKIDKIQSKLDSDDSGWNSMIDATLERIRPSSAKIGENHYRSLLSTQRQVSTLAALGLSFRNAIQQTTQVGTTIGNLGVKDTTVGMVKYLKQRLNPTTMKQYTQLLDEHGITNAGIAKEAYSDLLADGIGGVTRSKGAQLSDAIMIMSQKMDEFARGSAYEASKTASLRKGLTVSEANQIAAGDAARMNFLTSKVDMPIALNGDTVRSLSQFMTFSYKQAEAWKELGIKAIKNPETGQYQLQPKQMSKLVQMMAFYGLAFEGMSQVAGIEPEDNIPFYGNIFGDSGIPKSPLVSTLFGMNENTPGLLDIAGGLINPEGDSDFEKEESRNATFEDFTNLLVRSFVPAGSQIKKSVDGYNSMQNDGVVMKDGRVRFIQNAKPDDMLKNPVLFGQYATDDGKEWVDKKFPTLSEKQSEILQQQKSQEAKQRAYDFYSGLKSVGRKDNVTPKVKDIMKTQPAKAERLIRSHNEAVQKAVEAYTSQYGELSEYEQEYLMENYLITNGTLENMNKE